MGSIASFRVTITDSPMNVSVPTLTSAQVPKKVSIKNVSTGLIPNSFRFNFPGDSASNYVELAPGASYPVFGGLYGGENMIFDGVGGTAVAEIVIWEDNG